MVSQVSQPRLRINGILKRVHQVLGQKLRTAELDMADSVIPDDVDVFLDNAAWAIRSIYHTVLKASPGAAIFGQDMPFDIPFIADWRKIGDRRQLLTDRDNQQENAKRIDYDVCVCVYLTSKGEETLATPAF